MTDEVGQPGTDWVDVGAFCRAVEEHLARVNGGHLIRIVGPGFELVRNWALEGIPISIVCHGISQKAERHRAGRSKRPLRLEFCEADVRAVYDSWQRAVGLTAASRPVTEPAGTSPSEGAPGGVPDAARRPSLSKQIERAIERLSRSAGRLDLPETFRDELGRFLQQLVTERDAARGARGQARDDITARLSDLDRQLIEAARRAVGASELERLGAEAAADLAAFRTRLGSEAWQRSIDLGIERLLRDRLGLPTLGR